MKFLTVFAAVLAVAMGARSQWNLRQISDAIESPITNPSLIPVLTQALEAYIESIFSSQDVEYVSISTAPVDLSSWGMKDLTEAIESPNTDPGLKPYLINALETLMHSIFTEAVPSTATVSIKIPAMDVSYWTLQDLDYALSHSSNPELVPYLEQGLNKLMDSLFHGIQVNFVVLTIPIDIVEAVIPSPAVVLPEIVLTPETPEVVPSPVVVAPAPTPSPAPATSSPLVEIMLNINHKNSGPSPVVISGPKPEPFENPRPTVPGFLESRPPVPGFLESRPPVPGFLENRPIPVEPVNLPHPENNPIDIIAVAAPDINPVDLIHPVPVAGAGEHVDVGPM